MRFIKKNTSPPELDIWKTARKNAGQSCTYADLSGRPKRVLKSTLLKEQQSLCCYCQQKISNGGSTIEHFLPQDKFKLHEVDYLNLHLVCKCSRGLKAEDTYCDVRKGNDLMINAILHPDCESFFRYSKNGEILPNDMTYSNFQQFNKNLNKVSVHNQAIVHSINVLNLNSPDLIAKRKKQINDVLKIIKKLNTRAKVDTYLKRAEKKQNSIRFPSLVRYYLILHRAKLE